MIKPDTPEELTPHEMADHLELFSQRIKEIADLVRDKKLRYKTGVFCIEESEDEWVFQFYDCENGAPSKEYPVNFGKLLEVSADFVFSKVEKKLDVSGLVENE